MEHSGTVAGVGQIEVSLYTPGSTINKNFLLLSGFTVKVIRATQLRTLTVKDFIFRTVNKDASFNPLTGGEDVSVSLDVCSYSPNAEDGTYSILRRADGSVAKTTRSGWATSSLEIFEDQNGWPEAELADRLAEWGYKRRRVLEVEVAGVSYRPMDKITLNGSNYAILSGNINFRDYSTILTLIEL